MPGRRAGAFGDTFDEFALVNGIQALIKFSQGPIQCSPVFLQRGLGLTRVVGPNPASPKRTVAALSSSLALVLSLSLSHTHTHTHTLTHNLLLSLTHTHKDPLSLSVYYI